MSNGDLNKKKKKKAPVRDVRMAQDNTRVASKRVKGESVRARYLSAIEGSVKHLKGQLDRLEHNTETPEGPLKYKKNMTPSERIKIGKRMEELSSKKKKRK